MGFILDLLAHPVSAHLGIPRSIPAHLHTLSSLFSCVCIDAKLLAIATKYSVYDAHEIVTLRVPKVYPLSPCSNHLVPPCIVPL